MKKLWIVLFIFCLTALACAAPTGWDQSMFGSPTATTVTTTSTPTPVPTLIPSPTATLPSTILEVTPCGSSICVLPSDDESDESILARLCVVEVRGFDTATRDIACQSVVATVLARMDYGELSDGTVRGTILWGCKPDDCIQFPGYVVNGCDGIIPTACPWNYPDDIQHFRGVVQTALARKFDAGACVGYLGYDSRATRPADCVVRDGNGVVEYWYKEP